MKSALIVLLIISSCVGINLYNDQQADQRRAQKLLQFNESLDQLNSSFDKDPAIFLESILSNDYISHLHSWDELDSFRSSDVYSIDVQDHFTKDKIHLWGLNANWISSGLIDVQKDSDDSMFRYIFYADYLEPYSTAFSLSCSKELLEYIRRFEDLSYGYFGDPFLFISFQITGDIVTEFGETKEDDEYYFSRTFNASCNDYVVADENLLDLNN